MFRIEHTENVTLIYDVTIEDNSPWMVLQTLEYVCPHCNKAVCVDLSMVPPRDLEIVCNQCTMELTYVEEFRFKVELVPCYDYPTEYDPLGYITND